MLYIESINKTYNRLHVWRHEFDYIRCIINDLKIGNEFIHNLFVYKNTFKYLSSIYDHE